ncbi:MAG: glucose 1-dehydrogenase [Myxococcota bacterium]|nr:glucose 1-dehydrogenase [Myxococcota bacterium]
MPDAPVDPARLFDLEDRVAVVTGGSRGLGRAMCRAFARAGARVVVASRKGPACEALAEELRAETGRDALGVAFHAGRWADCDALADAAWERFGRVDVLVNNAGMSPLYPSLDEVGEELWDKVQAVNLKGAFRLSARLGTRMAAGDGGSIVNVSSIAAVQPTPVELPYAAAKAGLHAITVGMARAFGPKVRVNCIMPGPFLTDISKAWDLEAFAKQAERSIPLGRGGEPHEIVGAALYLASDASSYTTGAVLKVDGGAAFSPA